MRLLHDDESISGRALHLGVVRRSIVDVPQQRLVEHFVEGAASASIETFFPGGSSSYRWWASTAVSRACPAGALELE